MADEEISRGTQKNDTIYTQEELSQLVRQLLDDEITEGYLANSPLWAVITKTFKLTFLDETAAEILHLRYKEAKIAYRVSLPSWKWDRKQSMFLYNLDFIFESNLNRAKGFEDGRLNERVLISSQIKHATTVLAESQPVKSTGIRGVIGKVFGR